MGSERRVFLGGFRVFMVAENEYRTKLANKGQVSLPFPPDVSDAQRMPVVHLDANCHPGRARPDNVVARNQVTDVGLGSLADILTRPRHVRFTPNNGSWGAHPSQHLAVGYGYTPWLL